MSDTTTRAITPEQEARDMLERIGVDEAQAQSFSSGDVVELANLIAAAWRFTREDVALLRGIAQNATLGFRVGDGPQPADDVRSLADRLAALLQPE